MLLLWRIIFTQALKVSLVPALPPGESVGRYGRYEIKNCDYFWKITTKLCCFFPSMIVGRCCTFWTRLMILPKTLKWVQNGPPLHYIMPFFDPKQDIIAWPVPRWCSLRLPVQSPTSRPVAKWNCVKLWHVMDITTLRKNQASILSVKCSTFNETLKKICKQKLNLAIFGWRCCQPQFN